MSTLTMNPRAEEFILSEWDPNYTRKVGTLKLGEDLTAGTILMDDGSGKLVEYDANSPTDGGTSEAAGILLKNVDATAADTEIVYLARGPATVKGDLLGYPAGTDEEANTIESLGFLNPPIVVVWGTRTE